MKTENSQALENLSLYCHFGGLITVFIGIVISFIHLIEGQFEHIHVGLFIFITGYALAKISDKISSVLRDERS